MSGSLDMRTKYHKTSIAMPLCELEPPWKHVATACVAWILHDSSERGANTVVFHFWVLESSLIFCRMHVKHEGKS